MPLFSEQEARLERLARALINQEQARIIVPPAKAASGYWFGGGNLIQSPDGRLYLTGRYRNHGDSRTGLAAGARGLELAIFESADGGGSFEKILSFSKSDLDMPDRSVLSIEGAALRWIHNGVELVVSTEKDGIDYPDGLREYLKPGAGVWTIERLAAKTIPDLADAERNTILESHLPEYLHLKDPFFYERSDASTLLFCSHPFSWSSSNTGFVNLSAFEEESDGEAGVVLDFFPRGTTWDVAMTRATSIVDVPQAGLFSDVDASLVFYDGGESLRDLDEHTSAISRPRGYSCEELGGAAYILAGDLLSIERLSRNLPFFISPHGTGCSRYVDVLSTESGLFATWQQAQPDGSQPLVMNFVGHAEVEDILS